MLCLAGKHRESVMPSRGCIFSLAGRSVAVKMEEKTKDNTHFSMYITYRDGLMQELPGAEAPGHRPVGGPREEKNI